MPTIRLPDGEALNAEHLDFSPVGDGELELVVEVEDGTRLTARIVATGVTRVDAEDNPRGDEPIYSLDTDVRVRTDDVPESLTASDEERDGQWAK